MNDTFKKILALRDKNPSISQAEMARTLGVSRQRISQVVEKWTPEPERKLIYFIRRESDGCIKIGRTRKIADRLSNLKIVHRRHGRLEFLGATPGNRRAEELLHREFSPDRRDGEWFAPSERLMAYISSLPSISELPKPPIPRQLAEKDLEEGLNEDELRQVLSAACKEAGGQGAWAKKAGVSGPYVSDVLQGHRIAGNAICQALGYRRHTVYERLDIWEEKSQDTWEKDKK